MEGDIIITMRMLMVGKEIGGIIGRGGVNVESFRQQSGARITISTDPASPERIVTITGGQAQIHSACQLITEKIDKDVNAGLSKAATSKVPVTIRLIVPASQCGSIIGKGGVKIKEIRDSTGCSIQVQSEMLPNSSERTVTLSGAPTTIIHCIDMLIDVMIQYPAKTATVPYKPQGGNSPIIFHQGQAYMLQGHYAVSNTDMGKVQKSTVQQKVTLGRERAQRINDYADDDSSSRSSPQPLMGNEPRGSTNFPVRLLNATTQEVIVKNDVMGCIIGKGGSRINEIRSISGAQIKINQANKENKDDEETEGKEKPPQERKITITGSPEEISLAQYLINLSVQMFSNSDGHGGMQFESRRSGLPLPNVFSSPSSILGQPPIFGGSGIFGSGLAPGAFGAALMSAKHLFLSSSSSRFKGGYRGNRMRQSSSNNDVDFTADDDMDDGDSLKDRRKARRDKFHPYHN